MESSSKGIHIDNFYPHTVTGKIDDSFVGLKFKGNEIHFYYPETYRFSMDNPDARRDIIDFLRTIGIAKTSSSQLSSAYNKATGEGEFALLSYLWVIKDFLANGFYVNREKIYKTNQSGRIDWKRTMQSQAIVSNGNVIFPNITVSVKNTVDNLLVEIHRFCVKRSIDYIGWLFNLNSSFIQIPQYNESIKKLYIATLKKELDHTFDDDKRLRLKHLLNVVTGLDSTDNNKEFVYGVDSYYYIFERMIDAIFGTEKDLRDFNPKAKWQLVKNDFAETDSSDLRPDTILRNGEDVYILDSKFYRFGFTGREEDLPETTSIQKQITYGDYIKCNAKTPVGRIYNAFLLPYDKKRDVFRSDDNDNLQYIGFAKSTWKGNTEGYEFVHAFLIDLKHVVKTWNRFNHKDDQEKLIQEIEKYSNELPSQSSN